MTYGLRVRGPWAPELGHRFDDSKLLLDPYAQQINRPFSYTPMLGLRGTDTAGLVPHAVIAAPPADLPLRTASKPDVIYEVNVKAFSQRHPDIPEPLRGTVAALACPPAITHFKRLGIDTIELMPITAWIDERHLAAIGLRNAWGYNPISLFAPDPRLAPGGLQEVRDTIATLHENGFNVVLDVVFNHSGESDTGGPTLSFRGLDNAAYYAHHNGDLINDTGCGNTFALNCEPMLSLVLDSLRHWVLKTGFDGFRFDLATVLGRDGNGFSASAPLLNAIERDPALSTRIMIAEPWDIGPGGYQLGQFPPRWLEWNDKFRDDTRRFWRGDAFSTNAMATRLAGSSDVFAGKGNVTKSVNFIAAHDGFTLRDLTQFTTKNNFANGEDNRDGKTDEVTVPDGSPAALLTTLLLSRGVAMLTAGDELGRTQQGNNNAYAQDNDTTWLDWKQADEALIAETARLIALRKSLSLPDAFLDPATTQWFDGSGQPIDWNKADNPVVVLEANGLAIRLDRTAKTVTCRKIT